MGLFQTLPPSITKSILNTDIIDAPELEGIPKSVIPRSILSCSFIFLTGVLGPRAREAVRSKILAGVAAARMQQYADVVGLVDHNGVHTLKAFSGWVSVT